MGDIVDFSRPTVGKAATYLTSAGLYSGTVVNVFDELVEMEDVMFYAFVNPLAAAFPLGHLYLLRDTIQGVADPIRLSSE